MQYIILKAISKCAVSTYQRSVRHLLFIKNTPSLYTFSLSSVVPSTLQQALDGTHCIWLMKVNKFSIGLYFSPLLLWRGASTMELSIIKPLWEAFRYQVVKFEQLFSQLQTCRSSFTRSFFDLRETIYIYYYILLHANNCYPEQTHLTKHAKKAYLYRWKA